MAYMAETWRGSDNWIQFGFWFIGIKRVYIFSLLFANCWQKKNPKTVTFISHHVEKNHKQSKK